ncbi:MAG: hypothetical protein U9Q67_04745 [Patescibacteria group bacterium]|nr:hypothetical protein [Patescibacteria group bacterium]
MTMPKPNTSQFAPTQDHMNVEKIKDNMLILKNGVVSIVIQTNAVNFDLLSEPEQDAKIMAFGQLLNSVPHSFQIFIRTKKINIRNYIDYIKSFQNKQLSAGLKRQMAIYLEFVQKLIIRNEILDKNFYIIIPYIAAVITKTDPMKQLFGKEEKITNLERIVEQGKAYLYPKRDHVMKQLARMGIKSHQLSNEELTELLFEIYNPDLHATSSQVSTPENRAQIVTRARKNKQSDNNNE